MSDMGLRFGNLSIYLTRFIAVVYLIYKLRTLCELVLVYYRSLQG